MDIPKTLRYTQSHEWLKKENDMAITGITDYAQSELSDIAFIELPEIGTIVSAGETCGTIEAVKAVSDIIAVVSGEIVEINTALTDNPDTINSDPYGDGWFFKIKMSNPEEIENLMNDQEYEKFIKEEGNH